MTIRTIAIGSVAIVIAVLAVSWFATRNTPDTSLAAAVVDVPQSPLTVEVDTFAYEIVASSEARVLGLSGREEIPHDYGMLFVFPEANRYGFWMKDMLISIDIIWLANDGTILGIDANVSPESYPTPYYAPVPVARVLETRAGEAARQGWKVGTKLTLPL